MIASPITNSSLSINNRDTGDGIYTLIFLQLKCTQYLRDSLVSTTRYLSIQGASNGMLTVDMPRHNRYARKVRARLTAYLEVVLSKTSGTVWFLFLS